MNFLHLPIPLFVILQLFTSIVWSSDSSSISTSVASGSGSIPTTATSTGTTNSTGSASPTSSAHYPSLSGDSNCVDTCFAGSIAYSNCTSIVDVDCYCPEKNFTGLLLACVTTNCSNQVSTAEKLAQQFCNQASGHPTLSFSVPITTSSTLSPTSKTTSGSTSAPSSSTTNSAAKSMNSPTILMGLGAIMALVVVIL